MPIIPRNTCGSRRSGRIWLVLLILLLIPIIGFYVWYQYEGSAFFGSNEDNAPILENVTVGPFDHIVLEQGEIESSSNNEVKCTVKAKGSSGTPILTVLPEGTMVKKGDQLCQLDSSAFQDELAAQRITVGNNEALVISSEAAVKQAEISRQEYLDGTYLTEHKSILSEIALAQQALRTSELSLASAERLAAKGTLKSLQIEAEQFSVANARNTLDAAQGRLKVLDELTKAKMLVQFDSTIETSRAKLNSDRSMLEEEKSKLLEIQAQIEACNIRAPADGQVVHANKFSSRGGGSEFVVEQGAMLREQQTIFLLPDPNKMQVKAKVNESRVSLLVEGMPVRIRVGAVTDDLLGQIIKVNKYAEPGSFFSASVKEYATFIKIFDPPPTIRTGMTAEVRIFVKQIAHAIQIPVHAIYETKGHYFVLKPGKTDAWETKEVKIGATNEMFVTVSEGLTEADKVVLNPRSHLDLMNIPELADTENREQLAHIRSQAPEKPADGPSRGEGGKGGAPGGGDPATIAAMIVQRVDKNGDGKISKEEASADERMSSSFASYDNNGDGVADLAEVQAYMASRIGKSRGEKGGSGGGKGSPPGEGNEGRPRPPGGTE